MKFILSRTDDVRIHSKKWVVGYGLLFWLISRIVAMLLIIGCVAIANVSICVFAIVALFSANYFFTTDSFWNSQKKKYYKPSIYVSAIAFGLLHLIAFSNYDYTLIPYMLCVISVPFFGGCAITYYRVNLGFWWGVGLHVFNNIPAIVVMSVV